MPYYHRRRRPGLEKALQHIQEANELSKELGGTDEDVKEYFFSLSSIELKIILDRYEQEYGRGPREYAEKTLPSWKSGRTHMSGMVAARLFSLLPQYMPISKKYILTENLWKHVGPSSHKIYYVGLDVDLEEVGKIIKEHLKHVVINYTIPESMENRFRWLSQGDVNIKQQLLNHLRQQERELLSLALNTKLPVLINHIKSNKDSFTSHVTQVLIVGKHEVKIILDENVSGISETAPRRVTALTNDNVWIWWIVGIGILLWMLLR